MTLSRGNSLHRQLKKSLVALFVVVGVLFPVQFASAGTLPVTIHNAVNAQITGFKVRGAEVAGFKRVAPKASQAFAVTFPGRQCEGMVQIRFANGGVFDTKENFCLPHVKVLIRWGPRLRLVPWHQFVEMFDVR